ncbi:hypothetical protein GK047_17665 [Paenibacillus sp. SYP-B3998]|uniref:Uncharacterized protein n=1 Tax=Paenibacillus sp. SYP-B3998 TaxID=2678564 RepID=A0A6G4A0F1_9BACL|nr:hypothetical protein [Paenibacillus sp. SYP-B3998]NEW07830.1 hypothetical protein [Paenibacillus sp. SYP-B3998]
MDKELVLYNAITSMADRYKGALTPELALGADLYAVKIKKQLMKEGFTEPEAEAAKRQAKASNKV